MRRTGDDYLTQPEIFYIFVNFSTTGEPVKSSLCIMFKNICHNIVSVSACLIKSDTDILNCGDARARVCGTSALRGLLTLTYTHHALARHHVADQRSREESRKQILCDMQCKPWSNGGCT